MAFLIAHKGEKIFYNFEQNTKSTFNILKQVHL